MTTSYFSKEKFFDLSSFPYADIFDDTTNVWEVLSKLQLYVERTLQQAQYRGNYKQRNDVFVDKTAVVQDVAVIEGPAIIGKHCIISHSSFLRGPCLLGNNVKIGHATEVKHTIFLNGAIAAHLNYIGDSIIGNNVNISAGSVLANFRLDRKPVVVQGKVEKIDTGLLKFGAAVGDNTLIGVNAVLNPGTILGKHSIVYPLTSITGVYEDGEIIKQGKNQ